ncbi:hypothetical protein, partial [Roseateles sp. YR242]|uniref:hypothetical protein n=1 Tax=Roseateles sp. YR242 TaxID=1855305 RepID=UPI001C430D7F
MNIFYLSLLMAMGWIVASLGIALFLANISPHGMALLVCLSVILGPVAGILQAVVICLPVFRSSASKPGFGLILGLVASLVSFPIATLVFEGWVQFPSDSFQWGMLCCVREGLNNSFSRSMLADLTGPAADDASTSARTK